MITNIKPNTIFILCIFFSMIQLYALGQNLHKDRVNLVNGESFTGIIIEDMKPQYLKIKTTDFGIIQLDYKDIRNIFRRADLDDTFYKKTGHQYLSFSAGFGHSYGGIGVRFQQRGGRKVGFAYSIGVGIDKTPSYYYYNELRNKKYLLGIGLAGKFYVYKWIYLELGLLIDFKEIMYQDFHPFFMIGYDFSINNKIAINAGIGYYKADYFILNTENFAIDLGLMYRIPSSKK